MKSGSEAKAQSYLIAAVIVVILVLIAAALVLWKPWSTPTSETTTTGTTTSTTETTTKPPEATQTGAAASLKARIYSGELPISNVTLTTNFTFIYFGVEPDKADVIIYLFYDMQCPYCAMELVKTSDYLASVVSKNNASLVLVDLLVHEEAADRHAYIRCLAKKGAPVLAILHDYYSESMNKGSWLSLEALKRIAAKYGDWEISQDCINNEKKGLTDMRNWAISELGVRGTPTIIISSKTLQKAYMIPGYVEPQDLKNIIDQLLSGKEPQTG